LKRSNHVDAINIVEICFIKPLKIAVGNKLCCASIVYQRINPTPMSQRLGNQPAAIGLLTDIGLADQGFTTQFSATCRNGLCGICATGIINHDARASAGH
jgi:hypothetical protein